VVIGQLVGDTLGRNGFRPWVGKYPFPIVEVFMPLLGNDYLSVRVADEKVGSHGFPSNTHFRARGSDIL